MLKTPLPSSLSGEVQTRPITIDRALFYLVTGILVKLVEYEHFEQTGTLTEDEVKQALSDMLDAFLDA